jgi:hypothetical protein
MMASKEVQCPAGHPFEKRQRSTVLKDEEDHPLGVVCDVCTIYLIAAQQSEGIENDKAWWWWWCPKCSFDICSACHDRFVSSTTMKECASSSTTTVVAVP